MGVQGLLSALGINRPGTVLSQKGVVKIPGFLSKRSAAALYEVVTGSYAEIQQAIGTARASFEPIFLDQFETWNALYYPQLLPILKKTNPGLHDRVAAVAADVEAAQRRHLKGWALCHDRVYFRKHRTKATQIAWHIDADAAGMSGYGPDSINIWLPLQDVGVLAPSIEFVPGSHHLMKRLPLLPTGQAARTDEWVNEQFSDVRWTPQASLGDAIVFSQWTLHRTQTAGASGTERTSCEFRFIGA